MQLKGNFKNLTDEENETLTVAGSTKHFTTGETVITEGEEVSSIMIVEAGKLRVTTATPAIFGNEFMPPLGPGDVLGEISYMDGEGASATLIADGDTEIFYVPEDALAELIANDETFSGRFYKDLATIMARRLRRTNQWLAAKS